MTISELIAYLEAVEDTVGDIDVHILNPECMTTWDLSSGELTLHPHESGEGEQILVIG